MHRDAVQALPLKQIGAVYFAKVEHLVDHSLDELGHDCDGLLHFGHS